MTIGQLAGLIAAIAFAVLVVFLCLTLLKVSGVIGELKETVTRLNATIDIVTKDVDNLSIEVEGLLNKSNRLVDDVNGKLGKTDPLFTAIGDLGVSVSELNSSTKTMTANLVSGVKGQKKAKSPFGKFVKAAQNFKKPSPKSDQPADPEQEQVVQVKPTGVKDKGTTHGLKQFTDHAPSATAGEITIKNKEMNHYESK